MRGSDLPHGVTKDLTPRPWTRNPKRQGSGHVCLGWKSKAAQGREAEEGPGASATGGFRGAVQRFGVESSGWGRHREIRKIRKGFIALHVGHPTRDLNNPR